MRELFIYSLQVNLLLALIFLGYYCLLRKLTFYRLNRYYFLIGTSYALLFPFLNFRALFQVEEETSFSAGIYKVWVPVDHFVTEGQSVLELAVYVLVCLSVFFILRLATHLWSVNRIHNQSSPARWAEYLYREVPFVLPPFSFLKHIYIYKPQHSSKELEAIFKHESQHVRGLHTIDILWLETLLIIGSYNPFVWLMRKAVRQNLEFLTDQQVLEKGLNKQDYQYSLVRVAQQQNGRPLPGNSFSFKPLKNRIMMMNKKRSSKFQLGKYVFLLPALVFIGAGFTADKAEHKIEQFTDKAEQTHWFESADQDKGATLMQEDKDPLYIVNGKEVSTEVLQAISPDKIESMNVLKDKPAIDKYGAKAKNGVIEITLKKEDKSLTFKSKDNMNLLRGTTNEYGKTPLYIVNGKEVSPKEVNKLDTDQIQAVDVLKGKGAEEDYGKSAKNGVVVITLKEE